ncbi:MAG: tetratricopeptide repeat protein [Bacteroidales bacterium]|nr:tetratricopeptide repeat protein [Bacteroidales bacterium]HOI32489.1 tetratricopeptide repeat protein [Bacteroidales bacterium]
MKHLAFVILLLLSCGNTYADMQPAQIDSLTQLIGKQNGRERIETLIHLSEIYRKISVEKSMEADSSAEAYATQQGLDNMKGIILLSMGKTSSISGDYDLALDYMNQAVKALKSTKNYTELARTYINMGLVYKNLADYEASISYFDQALKLAFDHELKDQEAAAAANRATVYFTTGDYQRALESYQKAMSVYEETKDSLRFAKMLMNIGLVYWQWDKNDLALEMQLKAKEVFEQQKDLVELGRVYNNIGKIYYQDIHDTTLALEYYQRSLEMREKMGNQLGMAIVMANIGNIYRDKNQKEKAFENYEKSLAISQFIGYREGVALTSYYMGIAYQKYGQYLESNRMLDTTRKVSQSLGLSTYDELVNEAKINNYKALGDYESLFKEFKLYETRHSEMRTELATLKYELIENQEQIESLTSELNTKNQLIDNQAGLLLMYRLLLLFALLGLIVIGIRHFRKSKS